MSAEVQESGKKKGNSKQKKMTVRVDFTPMVDMNMLLITFFMLCTSLSKPQTMEISMPSNDKNITEEQQSKVKASQAITLLLGPDDKLYYYEGEPNYKDYTSLKETTYKPDGLRGILLKKNATAVRQVNDLKQKKHIFGLPLTLCEERGDGQLIALDREDNIYVIETVQRADYEEFYLQILDDMAVQRKRIQKNAADRKVYAVVCVTTLPETLKLAAEKDNAIRIFSYELNFRNVM